MPPKSNTPLADKPQASKPKGGNRPPSKVGTLVPASKPTAHGTGNIPQPVSVNSRQAGSGTGQDSQASSNPANRLEALKALDMKCISSSSLAGGDLQPLQEEISEFSKPSMAAWSLDHELVLHSQWLALSNSDVFPRARTQEILALFDHEVLPQEFLLKSENPTPTSEANQSTETSDAQPGPFLQNVISIYGKKRLVEYAGEIQKNCSELRNRKQKGTEMEWRSRGYDKILEDWRRYIFGIQDGHDTEPLRAASMTQFQLDWHEDHQLSDSGEQTEVDADDSVAEPQYGWARPLQNSMLHEPPFTFRQEAFINYPRFQEFDRVYFELLKVSSTSETLIDFEGPHSAFLQTVRAQAALYRQYNRLPAREPEAKAVKQDVERTYRHATNLEEAIQDIQGGPMEFRARVMRYPPRGLSDALYGVEDAHFFEDLCRTSFPGQQKEAEQFLERFQCVQSNPNDSLPTKASRGGTKADSKRPPLVIPFLVVEYKRDDAKAESTAKNQRLMYCVSVVRFLREMGIVDFPIIGVATDGPHATLCAAWISGVDEQCHVVRSDPKVHFDLTKQEDVIHFVVFLFKLRKVAISLWSKYNEKREALLSRISTQKSTPWTFRAQLVDLQLMTDDEVLEAERATTGAQAAAAKEAALDKDTGKDPAKSKATKNAWQGRKINKEIIHLEGKDEILKKTAPIAAEKAVKDARAARVSNRDAVRAKAEEEQRKVGGSR